MDPVSFTASLVTLGGAVVVSVKLVYNIRAKFKGAPKDVEKLLAQIENFEGLLDELTVQARQYQNDVRPYDALAKIWKSSVLRMEDDICTMNATFHNLETLIKRSSE